MTTAVQYFKQGFLQASRLVLLVAVFLGASFSSAQEVGPEFGKPPAGWLAGAIDAMNFETREMIISQKKYRVALKATFTDTEGRDLSFSDMDFSYAVVFELEPVTGDILTLKVVAYP